MLYQIKSVFCSIRKSFKICKYLKQIIAQIFASAQGNGRKGMGRHGVIFIMGS